MKGIGDKVQASLQQEGIFHVADLLHYFPKKYRKQVLEGKASLDDGEYHYVAVNVKSNPKVAFIRKGMQLISFYGLIEDKEFLFKIYNQRYVLRFITENSALVVYGKQHPERQEIVVQTALLKSNFKEGIIPEYKLPGISDQRFSSYLKQASELQPSPTDFLPEWLLNKHKIISLKRLYELVHIPKNDEEVLLISQRLKYQELFMYQAKNVYQRQLRLSHQGVAKNYQSSVIKQALSALPFRLTDSQREVLKEIFIDLKEPMIMQRVLQGDTGSGKTIVAFLAMLAVFTSNYQVAFMAPTEILASQHYKNWQDLFATLEYKVALLTGSTSALDRKKIAKQLREHELDGVIGTHTLFSHDIHYAQLGLVITDEQHRFGVNQRAMLKNKGLLPDVIYLSATPIPRTLAMTLFGDMDLSIITDKPLGRKAIKTTVVSSKDKAIVRNKMVNTLAKKGQIFVVAPTIEESEQGVKGVKTVYEVIKERYPKARVGLLHARMKHEKKNTVLEAFYRGEIDILVSTTVIEVGIDVSNASLMVIYRAERFGYAQLHQLRGRVGRGIKESECIVIYEGTNEIKERLAVLETIHDGFTLSEYDLRLRGFGDILGVMQSGILRLNYANIDDDIELFKIAKEDALKVLNNPQEKALLLPVLKKQIEEEQAQKL